MSDYREFQDGEVVPGTRYVVCRLIGTGGMGRVYEVEHVELGKRFVLKSLQRELSRREDLVARLRNEWRALARLEHANIVNVTDAGTSANGVPFYVMERLEGETLGALMHRERRLQPQLALAISAGILEGLHAAHQIGVVHRDVKPPNVFLTPTAVKILDFGIAKIKDAKDVITARGIAVGTPRYMSPEQAQGAAVDARSDIYATGLMLFEMVSGVGPFDDARDHNELLLAHLGQRAPLLSSICVVAPELDAIVAGMLAKDPRQRPASAREVAETLRALNQRYARTVGTQSPTINPRPSSAPSEPPTRVEGRRSAPALPAPETRPDGPHAMGRAASPLPGESTTVQPALEVATTLAHVLPTSGFTQRLPDAAPERAASFHGPDTLVERPTQAPTAVPGSAAERTEMLRAAPLAPGAAAEADPGPTRTFVPAVEAPNLTPPPVVPTLPAPVVGRRPSRPWVRSSLVAALAFIGAGGAAIALHQRHAPVGEPIGAALPPAATPAPPAAEQPAAPSLPPVPAAPPVVRVDPATADAKDEMRPSAAPITSRKHKKIFLDAAAKPLPPRSAKAPSAQSAKPGGLMPSSGL